MSGTYDHVVVGGGIVGLATAMTILRRHPRARLLLLEKEHRLAQHQTGHNSGVIHAGVYYPPHSLKARMCAQGAAWTRRFCDERGIPYAVPGKLIVATDEVEVVRMRALHERAQAGGLEVHALDGAQLREREPAVTGLAALWVPSTGIVDYAEVARAMAAEVRERGGEVRLGALAHGIRERAGDVEVDAGGTVVTARHLTVCGGLQADRLARLAGLSVDFRVVPFRGEYYRLPDARSDIVRALVYPVPDPALPFLGVHLTRTVDGGVTVGPNAVLGFAREGYPKWSLDRRDVGDLARFPGFWRLARTQLRTGVEEQWRSMSRRGYLALVRRYCPSVRLEDLLPTPAGIRAQVVHRDGRLEHDFLIHRTARMTHVCNAPSPAATSAMPIAAHIVDGLPLD